MKKVLFIAVALIVCTSFSFAVDLESESFDSYSLSPLTASALDYSVMPLADSSWSTTDSANLADIRNTLLRNTTGSILGYLYDIQNYLFYIKQSTDYMSNMNTQLNHIADILGYGDSVSAYPSIYSLIYHTNELLYDSGSLLSSNISPSLAAIDSFFRTQRFSVPLFSMDANGNLVGSSLSIDYGFSSMFSQMVMNLTGSTYNPWTRERSLYSLVAQLQEVLASDDDLALAESQKQNREEIEDSFLNGSSGSTSLGSSDFGDLSDVGGTVNDTLSLNGQASISSFTSGLAGADQEGQNWFSAATRDSLDSVSGGISTFALDDPYNMKGWEEQYSWVLGGG